MSTSLSAYEQNMYPSTDTSPAGEQAAAEQPTPQLASQTTAEHPWTVSLLSHKIHDAAARWPHVWIEGQIIEINMRRSSSGYITLRDNTEEISISVMGFSRFVAMARMFKQGDRVVVHGKPDIWIKATRLSFIADDIRRTGQGDLKARIDELRQRLKGEGLFDAERKIPLPEFPQCIGLICAPQARAEGDIITNVNLRWPTVRFTVVHAHVQGAQCPQDIIAAIDKLDKNPDIDVIIVARGGGSFEDLIGFSDEGVVRAAAACATPLISAIGHEDDWTLIDLAADMRASTPTDAAKRVVPDVHEQITLVNQAYNTMYERLQTTVHNEIRFIEGYSNRPSFTQPHTMLEPYQRFIDQSQEHIRRGLTRIIDDASLRVDTLHASMTALSPQATLNRGYAIVQTADAHVVDNANTVHSGDTLTITVKHGMITATTNSTTSEHASTAQ